MVKGHEQGANDLPYYRTDPHQPIALATVRDYEHTSTTLWSPTFVELANFLNQRPPYSPNKNGKAFIVGPCAGRRADINMPYADVAVLDADSKILPDGSIETGAPDLEIVHQALVSWDVSHLLYTTYSHGSGKGSRYRVLFPCRSNNKIELLAFLTHITGALQDTAGIPIALTKESSVWSQMWQLPKVSGEQAPYEFRYHLGHSFKPRLFAISQGLQDENGQPIHSKVPQPTRLAEENETKYLKRPSVISMFNRRFSSLQWLEEAGYTFHGQSVVVDERGEPQVIYRYKKPDSSSGPGVVAFVDPFNMLQSGEPNFCIYSHHTNDVLNNGHANDSFSVFSLLNRIPKSEAIFVAAELVRESVDAWMNEQYPSLSERSFKVCNRCNDNDSTYYNKMDWTAFTLSTVHNEPVPVYEQKTSSITFKPLPEYWKTAPARIVHSEQVFNPCPITEEYEVSYLDNGTRKLNLFLGWAIKPYPGKWPLLAEHLKYAICGGNDHEYEYLLNWFSHLVMHPNEKAGVALALRGGKGYGKSRWMHLLAGMAGRGTMVLGNNKLLTGQFNSHLETCLIAIVEESFWAGHHREEGVLKTLITDTKATFEGKGRDAQSGVSYTRVVLITNEDWVAPSSSDERRYFIPTITSYSKDKDIRNGEKGYFFPQLYNEMQNGGIEAFLHDMVERNASAKSVINVPDTEGLSEQRAYSLNGVQSWLYGVLRDAQVRVGDTTYSWTTSGMTVPEYVMLESVSKAVSSYERERNFAFSVQRQLARALGQGIQSVNGQAQFGPLAMCRAAFIEKTKLPKDVFNGGAVALDDYSGNVVDFRRS